MGGVSLIKFHRHFADVLYHLFREVPSNGETFRAQSTRHITAHSYPLYIPCRKAKPSHRRGVSLVITPSWLPCRFTRPPQVWKIIVSLASQSGFVSQMMRFANRIGYHPIRLEVTLIRRDFSSKAVYQLIIKHCDTKRNYMLFKSAWSYVVVFGKNNFARRRKIRVVINYIWQMRDSHSNPIHNEEFYMKNKCLTFDLI